MFLTPSTINLLRNNGWCSQLSHRICSYGIITEEKNHDRDQLEHSWQQGYQTATQERQLILDSVRTAIYSGKPQLFFIDGPGSTGKTFIKNFLLASVRSQDQVALAVTLSWIAAILLKGGCTSHSLFKIPLDIHSESLCNVCSEWTSKVAPNLNPQSYYVEWSSSTEAPLPKGSRSHSKRFPLKHLLVLRHHNGFCRYNTLNTPLNISGDFRQSFPVIPKASPPQIVA